MGCDSPLVLRPTSNGRHLIVGECYVDELKDAAALLGPLTSPWHVQVDVSPMDKQGIFRFLNIETQELHDGDPRIVRSQQDFEKTKTLITESDTSSGPTQHDTRLAFSRTLPAPNIRDFTLE